MNYILTEQHGKKIAVILNGKLTPLAISNFTDKFNIEFGDCEQICKFHLGLGTKICSCGYRKDIDSKHWWRTSPGMA
jgi:hypothetical protein